MLTLISPLWMWGAGAIAIAGAVALWRGGKNKMRVSSTILWRGLAQEAAGARRRAVDVLWLLLWAAAVLAAVAAAGPEWRGRGAPRVESKVRLEMRALPGAKEAEIFVRDGDANPTSALRISADGAPPIEVPVQGSIVKAPLAERLEVACLSAGREVARRTLVRKAERPLFISEIGPVHPLLRRVMEIQPGATNVDSADAVRVVLVAARTAQGAYRAATPEHDALVIYAGNVLPPDFAGAGAPAWKEFTPAAKIEPGAPSALTMDGGKPIAFAGTMTKMRVTAVPAEWEVIVRAGGLPLVMVKREAASNVTEAYLATTLGSDETNWYTDTSFPLFFTRLAESVRPESRGDGVRAWEVSDAAEGGAVKGNRVNLTLWAAWVAAGLAIGVAACLVRRGTIARG